MAMTRWPRLLKIYPDLALPRLGYLLADLLTLLWIASCLWTGTVVYSAVMTLEVIARGIIATGQQADATLTQVQGTLASLPLVGSGLHDALNPVHSVPQGLIAQGRADVIAIQHLAFWLAVIAGGVPLALVLARFIPWRIRASRGFRSLDTLLRQPGAHQSTATMQVLAGRALYTLPYDHLLRYSPDPIAEWSEGRYYNLARATMEHEGLDVRRYLRRTEGVAQTGAALVGAPLAALVPEIGDEHRTAHVTQLSEEEQDRSSTTR